MAKKEMDTRFNKFGTVAFTGVSRVNDFIGYLEQGRLMGTKCKKCGMHFFPPRADCCHSLSSDMEWFEVTGTGKLMSFSTLAYAPTGFGDDLPYTIALLDYGDFKVFGRLDSAVSPDKIMVGTVMKTKIHELKDGRFTYSFQKA